MTEPPELLNRSAPPEPAHRFRSKEQSRTRILEQFVASSPPVSWLAVPIATLSKNCVRSTITDDA
jgi:hypothetical protein